MNGGDHLTHGDGIFVILDPPAYEKYSTCWVSTGRCRQVHLSTHGSMFFLPERSRGATVENPKSGVKLDCGEKLIVSNKEFNFKWRGLCPQGHSIPEGKPLSTWKPLQPLQQMPPKHKKPRNRWNKGFHRLLPSVCLQTPKLAAQLQQLSLQARC